MYNHDPGESSVSSKDSDEDGWNLGLRRRKTYSEAYNPPKRSAPKVLGMCMCDIACLVKERETKGGTVEKTNLVLYVCIPFDKLTSCRSLARMERKRK